MDQQKAFIRCMEVWAELEGIDHLSEAFIEIVQDSQLSSQEENDLIDRFKASVMDVQARLHEIKAVYIDLIATLN